jgi:hypothetical protein
MKKMRDENGNIILNIVYGSNHFEPIDLFNNVSNNMDISTNDVDNDTKNNCTCAMDRNDVQNKHSTKQKRFTWTFHLSSALTQVAKNHLKWTMQEIG